jgi:K+-transporting ATPase ATPase C chain
MILAALRATALLVGLCCVLYPAVVTGLAQVAFPNAANGSLVHAPDGEVVGSALVGQAFVSPGYLQGRPSAVGYDASTSGGSNFGVTSTKLADRRATDLARLRAENPDASGPVPAALLAASGSGLDPHLPPDAARWQLPRIAKARGVDLARVEALLDERIEGRDLGVLGEPRVNVLAFNLALDRRLPAASGPATR